jgi:hypothetical protein
MIILGINESNNSKKEAIINNKYNKCVILLIIYINNFVHNNEKNINKN